MEDDDDDESKSTYPELNSVRCHVVVKWVVKPC